MPVIVIARLILAVTFLSAVADRFGLWGAYGTGHVAWGDFAHFTTYTHLLTRVFPVSTSSFFAWSATIAEIIFGLLLLVGWFTQLTAFLSAGLTLTFAIGMFFALGPEAPLNASVFSDFAVALLLMVLPPDRFTIDDWLKRRG